MELATKLGAGTDDALVKAAAVVAGRLRERVPEGERLEHVPDETIADFEEAGLHRLTFPRSRNGYQASMRTQVDVQTEIGKADGSAAWVLAVYHTAAYWICGFSDEAQDEFFSSDNPKSAEVYSANATATPVSGGYTLTGGWPFASGQHHAGWILVPAVVAAPPVGGVPDVRAFLVPKSEFVVADDWHVTGLVASASNSVSLDDVFVPSYRSISFIDSAEGRWESNSLASDPYYNTPLVPKTCIAGFGTPLGLAYTALDLFRGRIEKRPITYTQYVRQADAPVTHINMAEAKMTLDHAQFHAYRQADFIDTMIATGGQWDLDARVLSRADLSWCVKLCRDVIEIVQKASGANAIRRGDPLQYVLKDIMALSLHAYMLYNSNAEIYGRVLCGLDPGVPQV